MQSFRFMPALPTKILALFVLLVGLESHALTLGRVQGAALIGRALDVSIQVQLDPGQSITSPCFEADVFHGDTRQNPARVQLRVEPTASAETVRLRIVSQSPIDEPIVTIYLRAGCAQMISRRYVMLADIISEQAAPIAPRDVAVPLIASPGATGTGSEVGAPVATRRAPTGAEAGQSGRPREPLSAAPARQTRQRSEAARSTRSKAGAVAGKAPVAAASKAPVAAPASKAIEGPAGGAVAGQSRLKLDPLELLSERVATLESTTAVSQTEAEIRDSRRLEALEASIRTLVALSARNEASLLEIRSRLQQMQGDRYSNPVVYLLAALLLASLLAILYLLTRRQRHADAGEKWWDGTAKADPAPQAVRPPEPLSGPAPLTSPSTQSQPDALTSAPDRLKASEPPATVPQPAVRAPAAGSAPVDVSLVEMSESTFDRLMQSGGQHSAVRKPPAAQSVAPQAVQAGGPGVEASRRMRINSDELIDIRQRAEFFVTLGQTDQAVQVLESRIAQDGESSPQAFLDLLKLFHALGLKADYRQVRADFSLLFNAQLPEFADFANPGKALEDYPVVIDRLVKVWNTDDVLDTIEDLLFRPEDGEDSELFELEAFRDLLTLHAVAQAVRSDGAQASGAVRTSFPELDTPGSLDIDLSALGPLEAEAGSSSRPGLGTGAAFAKDVPNGNLIDFDLSELPNDKPSDRA
jgi:pilus assembly protein FimV